MGFASKLYAAGLIATIFIFACMAWFGLYFYGKSEQLHAIDIEAKAVRLNLIEIQAQAYAFYSSGEDIHFNIHQNLLHELQGNMGRLKQYIDQLGGSPFSNSEALTSLSHLTLTMQKNVIVYDQHFNAALLEFQATDTFGNQLVRQHAVNDLFKKAETDLNNIELDVYDIEDVISTIINATQTGLVQFAVLLLLAFIVLATLANRILVKLLTRPLVALAQAADHVGEGNLTTKVNVVSHDEVGGLAKAFNVMIDNIRHSREELIASEQYEARQIMASMGEGLLVLNDESVIIKVNPALCDLLTYSEHTLIGMPLNHLLEDDGAHVGIFFNHDHSTITHIKNAANEPMPTIISGSPMSNDNGKYTGAVLVVSDMRKYLAIMADKDEAVKNLEQAQHQRLESLGLMAGGIAHDFNNLLTPIICNTELLLKTNQGNTEAQRYLDQTLSAAMQASRLSKQMLAYSGSGRLASQPIALRRFVSNMSNVLHTSVADHLQLKMKLDKTLPLVDGDIAELEQMLLNLVINASDAMTEHSGEIIISTIAHDIDQTYLNMPQSHCKAGTETGQYIAFVVQDFGCGMSKEIQQKLFDPFFTTKFTGRGLGMSAVLGIVYSHRGVLHINSIEGKGTTFTASFPVSMQQKPKKVAHNRTVSETTSFQGHLLVVDDDELITEVLVEMLKELGCTSIQACNGQEGVEAYGRYQDEIDAVILDMTMPVMSGAECFAKLIKINPDVKVILSSGYAQVDLQSQFSAGTLSAYLQKPYNHAHLIETLGTILK